MQHCNSNTRPLQRKKKPATHAQTNAQQPRQKDAPIKLHIERALLTNAPRRRKGHTNTMLSESPCIGRSKVGRSASSRRGPRGIPFPAAWTGTFPGLRTKQLRRTTTKAGVTCRRRSPRRCLSGFDVRAGAAPCVPPPFSSRGKGTEASFPGMDWPPRLHACYRWRTRCRLLGRQGNFRMFLAVRSGSDPQDVSIHLCNDAGRRPT